MNVGYPILEGAAIPGDPDGLRVVAARFDAARTDVESVQQRVAVNGLQGEWTGTAADTFRGSLDKLPAELSVIAAAFERASDDVGSFAGQLAGFQEKAAYYARQIESQETELRAAQQRHSAAQSKVDEARLKQSLAADPVSLKTAGDAVSLALSLLECARGDVEESSSQITRLRGEARENRQDYDQAVSACCSALDGAGTTPSHHGGSNGLVIPGIISWVNKLVHDFEHDRGGGTTKQTHHGDGWAILGTVLWGGGEATGITSALGFIMKSRAMSGLSINRLGAGLRDLDENPWLKGAGTAFNVVNIGTSFATSMDESRGESGRGRATTVAMSEVGAGVLFVPVVGEVMGGANALDGGALSADMQAISDIAGGAVSGGWHGANVALNTWATDAYNGSFDPVVAGIAHVENAVIDRAYPVVASVSHIVSHAVSHGVDRATSDAEQWTHDVWSRV